MQRIAANNKLIQNLHTSIRAVVNQPKIPASAPSSSNNKNSTDPPPIHDPFRVWVGQNEEPPIREGAVLVQLTTAGLVNALAGQPGGIVDSKMVSALKLTSTIGGAGADGNSNASTSTYGQVRELALALHRAVQTKTEADFLVTTPKRIQAMLCADLEPHEFRSIRRRIYETVVEGRGRHTNDHDDLKDIPVASRIVEHDIEKVSAHIMLFILVLGPGERTSEKKEVYNAFG